MQRCGRLLWALERDIDSYDEDVTLGTRSDAHVPFVANPQLGLNRFDHNGAVGAESVDAVAGSAKHNGKIRAAVGANLPEAVERQARFNNAVEQIRACSALNVQRITASNVDPAFAEIGVVACKRSDKGCPVLVGVDRAARGKLMRDVAGAEPLASRQRRGASRKIQTVRGDEIHTSETPSEQCRLNVD